MKTREADAIVFFGAGAPLVAVWVLYFLLLHDPPIPALVDVGWAAWAVGLLLIGLAITTLRRRGWPEQGQDFTKTTMLVDTGVYALVRHPLYTGWAAMYIAVMLFSQHWLILLLGAVGIVCLVLIVRQEEGQLIDMFGQAYERYRAAVPAMNLPLGLWRWLRGRRRIDDHPSA